MLRSRKFWKGWSWSRTFYLRLRNPGVQEVERRHRNGDVSSATVHHDHNRKRGKMLEEAIPCFSLKRCDTKHSENTPEQCTRFWCGDRQNCLNTMSVTSLSTAKGFVVNQRLLFASAKPEFQAMFCASIGDDVSNGRNRLVRRKQELSLFIKKLKKIFFRLLSFAWRKTHELRRRRSRVWFRLCDGRVIVVSWKTQCFGAKKR